MNRKAVIFGISGYKLKKNEKINYFKLILLQNLLIVIKNGMLILGISKYSRM